MRHRSYPAHVAIAGLFVALAACRGDEQSATTAPAPDTVVVSASSIATPSLATAPATTPTETPPTAATAVVATAAETTLPAPSEPWSTTAATDFAAVLAAADGSGDTADVLERLFANPIPVALPPDAALTAVYVNATRGDGGFDINWDLSVSTAADPADIEANLAAFSDPRFESGVRVESTLDTGVFITLNNPATETGVADGWDTMSFTVGPETSELDATRPHEIEIDAERFIAGDDPGLSAFVSSWLTEMPVADGLELQSLEASMVRLSDTGVWLNAVYAAAPESFAALVAFYAQDRTGGALVLDANTPPDDLTGIDRFNAGFFPTLAGYTVFLIVERDPADPAAPVTVSMEVRLDPTT